MGLIYISAKWTMLKQYLRAALWLVALLGGLIVLVVGIGVFFFGSKLYGIGFVLAGGAAGYWGFQTSRADYFRQLNRINDETGLKLVEAFGLGRTTLVLDAQARKLGLLTHMGMRHIILDFNEIDDWELRWTEVSRDGRLSNTNVHFAFRTKRIDMPVFTVPVISKTLGETWSQKLRILLA